VASKKKKSVLLLAEWMDPRLQHGIARYAREAGWHLNLDSLHTGETPFGWNGDGCIAMAGRPRFTKILEDLRVPVVDVTHQTQAPFPRIHEDDQAIGCLAAEHFLDLGFKHFLCYRTDSYDVSKVRRESFTRRVEQAGHHTAHLLRKPSSKAGKRPTWTQRMAWITRELEELPKPLAIFCIDDRMAVNIIEACSDSGLDVPDDVAVLGVGNLTTACECSPVGLSSIKIDYDAFGYQAAVMLDQIIHGAPGPVDPVLVPPQGVEERRSTHALAVDDPAGRKAIRFMLDRFTTPIDVMDMAREGRLTRRQLTYITQKELGKTPAQLLEDLRIKQACELLLATDYKVERVAFEAGLGTALRLQRIFRRRYKTSPGAWRKVRQAADPDPADD